MSVTIHPSAAVAPEAELGAGVRVGPFAVVARGVMLEAGVIVGAHAVLEGRTRVGAGTRVGSHSVIGGLAQVRGDQAPGALEIGPNNIFGEFVSIHGGSGADGVTRIGASNMLMAYCHVAHDCQIGAYNELANGAQLAGHAELGDRVTVGGLVGLHQFVRVGGLAMIGGGAMVSQDIPPYCVASGDRARLFGVNEEGLRRAEFDATCRSEIRAAVKCLLASGCQASVVQGLEALGTPAAGELLDFIRASRRGVCRSAG